LVRSSGYHRELNPWIAKVGIKNPFQAASVSNLPIIHWDDPFSDWNDLWQS
jgi:hypothetical protein